jgi:TorA maturation chaperone TorD
MNASKEPLAAMNASADSPEEQGDLTLDNESLASVMRQRSSTYGLLARLYRKEVDQELLDQLLEMLFPANTGNDAADSGYYGIAKYLSNVWEGSIDELAVDYARTFIGSGVDGHSAAYPFESVYTSPKRLTMANARDEVLAIYRSEGIDKTGDWEEGEDHLAAELEFMGMMCTRCTKALDGNDDEEARRLLTVQRNFLEDHLAAWVPEMTTDMRGFSHTGFYQGLANLTDGFLETERELLSEMLS